MLVARGHQRVWAHLLQQTDPRAARGLEYEAGAVGGLEALVGDASQGRAGALELVDLVDREDSARLDVVGEQHHRAFTRGDEASDVGAEALESPCAGADESTGPQLEIVVERGGADVEVAERSERRRARLGHAVSIPHTRGGGTQGVGGRRTQRSTGPAGSQVPSQASRKRRTAGSRVAGSISSKLNSRWGLSAGTTTRSSS